jgi:acyl carrier protein
MSVFDEVKEIIVDHLAVDADEVKMESSFVDDLGADSLDTVEMIMALEEKFGVTIEDSEAEKLNTVGDAVRFIEANKS